MVSNLKQRLSVDQLVEWLPINSRAENTWTNSSWPYVELSLDKTLNPQAVQKLQPVRHKRVLSQCLQTLWVPLSSLVKIREGEGCIRKGIWWKKNKQTNKCVATPHGMSRTRGRKRSVI